MKVPDRMNFKKSMQLYKESCKHFPAGVNSNARIWRSSCPTLTPCTLFIKKAFGSKITDVDGNNYIDYRLGYGPVILGHSYPKIRDAVHKADEKGLVFALENEMEIHVAKKIKKIVPSIDFLRFANSGTEATMAAVRVARAYTKKEKIIKFDGHYHGSHDYVLFSTHHRFGSELKKNVRTFPASEGIPRVIKSLVTVEDWNDFEAIERTVKSQHDKIAAIITEPIMGNSSGIMPRPGYLRHLRELCDKYNIVLIFDEVKTGFRVGLGGAQEMYKVNPDISTYAKALANGYPIAMFGGHEDIMSEIGPGKVLHGGTYSANPISLTAANATLGELMKSKVFKHINWYGRKMMHHIDDVLTHHNIPHAMLGTPGMFQFVFTKKHHVYNYRDMRFCDKLMFAHFQYELLKRGVMLDEDNEECIYHSYSHSKRDLEHTKSAFEHCVHDALIPKTIIPSRLM